MSKQQPIDAHWHEKLLRFPEPTELYLYLMPTTAKLALLRNDFDASDHSALPNLRPPAQFYDDFVRSRQGLANLRTQIASNETNEHVHDLYLARIDELVANCDIWLAAYAGDQAAFNTFNQVVYGVPDRRLFNASCAWLRDFATKQLSHPTKAIQAAAESALQYLPQTNGDPTLLLPDESTYRLLSSLHAQPGGYWQQLFKNITFVDGQAIDQLHGDAITEQVLANIQANYTIADASDGFWGVRHASRQVVRPQDYQMSPTSFAGIVSHEVGSHLLERANGLRSPLQLLGSGLDRYDHVNEGRAYMREQLALGSLDAAQYHYSWRFAIVKHMAISLGIGISGRQWNFAEIYNLVTCLYLLWTLLEEPDVTLAQAQAADMAWVITTRVLKGTAGQGGAYRKDVVYLEGNVRCWRIAKDDPLAILRGDLGKFDITNKRHIDHLTPLEILR